MSQIHIGWAEADLTPERPVLIAGQFHARVSEGVADPITATALALDAGDDASQTAHAVLVSCDLVVIPNALRDAVRDRVGMSCPGLDPMKVVLGATHTHTGPELRLPEAGGGHTAMGTGVALDVEPVADYVELVVDRIADAVASAWQGRRPGAIAFGEGYAVVGRNRRWVDTDGAANMYGDTDTPAFSHIEGYEDHSVGVLATRSADGSLTGLLVNVPCTAQVSEQDYTLSADYWHETRTALRTRYGRGLFVLPLCGVAGDQSPHLLYGQRTADRMLDLRQETERQTIARRIANAVGEVLSCLDAAYEAHPVLRHEVIGLDLPMRLLSEADVEEAEAQAAELQAAYQAELRKVDTDPSIRSEPRWYVPVSYAFRRMRWSEGVRARYEAQSRGAGERCAFAYAAELHVLRLGEAVIATNPFELYLDYGIYMKARSHADQTFLVQLAGPGTYVPSARSIAAGGYGSIPASTPVGPEGGRRLSEATVEAIARLWPDN